MIHTLTFPAGITATLDADGNWTCDHAGMQAVLTEMTAGRGSYYLPEPWRDTAEMIARELGATLTSTGELAEPDDDDEFLIH